jgi:Pilus formation protein N terminal region
MLHWPINSATNTLHLHFIHHFAVKSAVAACAEVPAEEFVTRRRRPPMKAKMDRCGARASRTASALVWLALAALLPQSLFAAEAPLGVVLDQAALLKLPEKVATIVIGNPAIADVAVQSGGLLVVTGKGYGSTNLIALDRAGVVLLERSIVVRGPKSGTIAVYRGAERETYSCTPDCERRITLGDSAGYFGANAGQADLRNAQATNAAAASKQGGR